MTTVHPASVPETTEKVLDLTVELFEMPRLSLPVFPTYLGQATQSGDREPDAERLGDIIDLSIAMNGSAIYLHELSTGRYFKLALRPVLEEACRAALARLGVTEEVA